MYDEFYGFRKRPFSLNPDPSYLYQSKKHQTALSLMEYALINEAAFCVITGEPGIGKTTLVRQLLYQIDGDYKVGLLTSTHQSFNELLKLILIAFDIDSRDKDQIDLYKAFYKFLIQQYSHHHRSVLIIDEAQNLALETLEELRMLSNVNVDKHNVLQIVLVGQESLRERLKRPELSQFAQRIAVDYNLEPLDRIETHAYILHRLKIAGNPKRMEIFGLETCDAVYRYTTGIPRLINMLCDLALVYGYAEQQRVLEPELINEVVNDKKKGGLLPLREHDEPFNEADLDVLSELHKFQEDDLVDYYDATSDNEEEVFTKVTSHKNEHFAPALDHLVIGRIFDGTPIPANEEKDVQSRSFAHWCKHHLHTFVQRIKKHLLNHSPVAKLLRNLPNEAYRFAKESKLWLLAEASKLNGAYLQVLKRYRRSISFTVFIFVAMNLFFMFTAFNSDVTSGTANAVTPHEAIATETSVSQNQTVARGVLKHVAYSQRMVDDWPTDTSSIAGFMPVDKHQPTGDYVDQSVSRNAESIVVKQGQTLSDLLAEVYGRYDVDLLYAVLRLNPHIKSPDLIMVGQEIQLPTVAKIN